MKKLILSLVLCFAATPSFATEVIASARAVELSAHRVEKLVNLKKLDGAFLSKLQTFEISKLTQSQPGEPAFLATVSQYPGVDGTKNQVEIILDDQGKSLSFKVRTGATAVNAPDWGNIDSATMIEKSLHFLLDHGSEKPDLKPFYASLLTLNLSKVMFNNQNIALVTITAKDTQANLLISLKLDGSFLSYEIK